jgi:hypothetical protein
MDEYGIRIVNIFYNRAAGNILLSFFEGPSREVVEKHHKNMELNVLGVKCTWITEVQATVCKITGYFCCDNIASISLTKSSLSTGLDTKRSLPKSSITSESVSR